MKAGHLSNVLEHRRGCGRGTYITAECVPEMSVRKKRYKIEFHLGEERRITESHCTCVAGVTGQCKHSASLFLFVNRERASGKTDEKQVWSAPSQRSQDLYPKGEKIRKMCGFSELERPSFKMSGEEGRALASDMDSFGLTDACLFKSLKAEEEESENEQELCSELPPVPEEVKGLLQNELLIPGEELVPQSEEEKKFFLEKVVCSRTNAEKVLAATQGQSKSREWFLQRKYRISASKAHKISRAKPENRMKYFVGSLGDHPNLRYGREMEAEAKEKYQEITSRTVYEAGLVIKSCQPWLCASPDGFVKDENDNMITLEVKCPVSCSGKPISVPYLDDSGLKKSHEYYSQIQIQMYCANVGKCHFFVYSSVDCVLIEISRDDVFL